MHTYYKSLCQIKIVTYFNQYCTDRRTNQPKTMHSRHDKLMYILQEPENAVFTHL